MSGEEDEDNIGGSVSDVSLDFDVGGGNGGRGFVSVVYDVLEWIALLLIQGFVG